jgi:hypothetical protein
MQSDAFTSLLGIKIMNQKVKRLFIFYKVSMKITDNLPIFFKISVNALDIKSSRSRGAGDNSY